MIVIPKKTPADATPVWQEPHRPSPPTPSQPIQVEVKHDNSFLVALVQKQQEQLDALARQFDTAIAQLVAAVTKLEPGRGFSVDIVGRDHQGKISTIKIRKE